MSPCLGLRSWLSFLENGLLQPVGDDLRFELGAETIRVGGHALPGASIEKGGQGQSFPRLHFTLSEIRFETPSTRYCNPVRSRVVRPSDRLICDYTHTRHCLEALRSIISYRGLLCLLRFLLASYYSRVTGAPFESEIVVIGNKQHFYFTKSMFFSFVGCP